MKMVTKDKALSIILTLLFFFTFETMIAQPGQYQLYLIDVKTGDVEQLTNLPDVDIFNGSFSNNGKYIVADGSSPDGIGIGIADVKTGEAWGIDGGDGGNDASWSPNGNMIIFDLYEPGSFGLNILPPEGGTPWFVREFGFDAEWAQNSEWVVFFDGFTGGLKSLNVFNGDEYFVSPFGWNPTWSPNGQWIAFVYGDDKHSDIFKIEVDSTGTPLGPPIQLTDDGPMVFNGQPSWSNNSKTIVFHSNRGNEDFDFNIWTISDDGTNPTMLAGFEGKGDFDPSFSKNGKWVVFSSNGNWVPDGGGGGYAEPQSDVVTMEQNFPNPFTQETAMQFSLPKTMKVNIHVYDAGGALVKVLASNEFGSGTNRVKWDGKNENGELLPNGIYTCRLEAGDQMLTQRMILLR